MAYMRSRKERAVTGLSVGGKSYEPDDDGIFDVAAEHVKDALDHGLVPFEDAAPVRATKQAVATVEKPDPKAKTK